MENRVKQNGIKVLGILISLFLWQSASAQEHCDGSRYINKVFTSIDSTIGVEYGQNITAGGNSKTLRFDLYYPESEFFFRRPLVVLAHGGSFIGGNRQQLRRLCVELAERGYVAATIDYRLYDNFNDSIDSVGVYDVVTKAVSDMKAAVRWFKNEASNANEYGIDTNLVLVGGVSAGAITALQYAYLDSNDYQPGSVLDSVLQANGGIRGNSGGNYEHSEDIIGVVNFSGALKDARWIDPGEPTVISVHDEFDTIVPYGQAITTELGIPIEISGSKAVHAEALEDGIRSQLITIEGSDGHVSYFLNGEATPEYKIVVDSSTLFMEYTICDRLSAVDELVDHEKIRLYPNPASTILHINAPQTISKASVIDQQGRIVQSVHSDRISSLNVSDLKSGLYLLKLTLADGLVQGIRFVRL